MTVKFPMHVQSFPKHSRYIIYICADRVKQQIGYRVGYPLLIVICLCCTHNRVIPFLFIDQTLLTNVFVTNFCNKCDRLM